ncbi:MAG: kdpD [Proteobacteria bacterium]|nr:kdpD [Pseudomonadota bacterium]
MSDASLEIVRPALPKAARYALAIGACALVTLITLPFRDMLDLANAVMLFLLVVFLVALKLGRGPAVLAAFLSVALFDFFLVPPHFTFAVNDVLYLITFAVMLAIGLLTTELTANLQEEAERVRHHEQETRDLYELARSLTGAATLLQVTEAMQAYLVRSGFRARLFLLDNARKLDTQGCSVLEKQLLNLAMANAEMVTGESETASAPPLFLPLQAPMCVRGVMAVYPETTTLSPSGNRREFFMTLASLIAIAVERLHYVEVAQRTQIQMSAEKLRSSVLSTLSHDLRTPLTTLVGLADTLAETPELPASARDNASLIRDQSQSMCNLLTNLLDMARLQSGKVTLRREWQLFEDAISASLHLLKPSLGARPLVVELQKNLPLVEFDAVLIERVLCNLIENAAKYSGTTQPIEIRAFVEESEACIAVCDHGSGFPAGQIDHLFELFERGEAESAKPGVGLGLAICKAIVEAHGGRIHAVNQATGGACVTVRLPLGEAPVIEEEEEHG